MRHQAPELLRLLRYGIVGLATNASMYAGYLVLSSLGIGPKTAFALLYVPGVLLAFFGNRGFTFRHRGAIRLSMVRYSATYAFGFVFCFAAMVLLVDWIGLPPDPVVIALILITAAMLYWLQRVWVFNAPAHAERSFLEQGRARQSRREPEDAPGQSVKI